MLKEPLLETLETEEKEQPHPVEEKEQSPSISVVSFKERIILEHRISIQGVDTLALFFLAGVLYAIAVLTIMKGK